MKKRKKQQQEQEEKSNNKNKKKKTHTARTKDETKKKKKEQPPPSPRENQNQQAAKHFSFRCDLDSHVWDNVLYILFEFSSVSSALFVINILYCYSYSCAIYSLPFLLIHSCVFALIYLFWLTGRKKPTSFYFIDIFIYYSYLVYLIVLNLVANEFVHTL